MPSSEYMLWEKHLTKYPPSGHIIMLLLAKMGLNQEVFFRGMAGVKEKVDPADWFFWIRKDPEAEEQERIDAVLTRSARVARERAAQAQEESDAGT